MPKIFTLFLLLCASYTYSQNITLKGKITDSGDFPLESATIYLTAVKDSSVVDYTISNKNGNWELKTRKITQPFFLKVSYTSMADYKQRFESLDEDRDFGTIKLADRSTELGEVVIESEIPPIRIKSDTLEFNASSFKVRPDSNVETLLKQLPGVDIDAEGKITVNGKEVNQILVNGKPFFDKDGKIALQNLPADIINKVQVSDTKTKQEELSGEKATGNEASINLTIDEDKNKGLFGKFMGGYGSAERYETSALVNYFSGKRKISVLASSNNINTTGFSMNEIFDSMGGGRNMSIYTNSDTGSFGINGMSFGGGSGITQSSMVGLNYSDEWAKGLDGSGSYFFNTADSENQNRSDALNFVTEEDGTDNSYRRISSSRTDSDKYAHNFNTEFNFEIDSTSHIFYTPKFVKARSRVSNTSDQFSERVRDAQRLNESSGYTFNENENTGLSNNVYYNKNFAKKRRNLSLSFESNNRKDDGSDLNQSVTNEYDPDGENPTKVTIFDRIQYSKQKNDSYNAGIEYSEPATDSMSVKIGMNYKNERISKDRDGYDFNAIDGSYSLYNDELSSTLTSKRNTFAPTAGFNLNYNNWYIRGEFGPNILQFDNYATYKGIDYNKSKSFVLPIAELGMNYSFSKSKSLWLSYSYSTDLPEADQMLPVPDVTNPLYTTIGNADLTPERYHYVYMNFRDYDYATRSGYSINGGGMFYNSQIVSATDVDDSAKTFTTYENVSGGYWSWFGANWNKSIKREAHNFKFNLGLRGSLNMQKGVLNKLLTSTQTLELSPKFNLTYEYGELLTISPSYSFTYRDNIYTHNTGNASSNFVHRFNLQTTNYWPKHVVFGNDFGYTYNSQQGGGFKKDFYLWNTSLGYNFLNDKLLFKVKVYDILNQNLGTSRSIQPTAIVNQENTVLKRYVMFSLTFKLDKFGTGKKEQSDDRFWW